jgi:putative membrane protein
MYGTAMAASVPACAQTSSGPYEFGPHMMCGLGMPGMIFGPLFIILVLVIVIAAVVMLVRWLGGRWHGGMPPYQSSPMRTPLDILKDRFTRGEIGKLEFEERRCKHCHLT